MVEQICAEVLLSGLKYVSNKSMDYDSRNNIFLRYPNSAVYVVPDDYSLIRDCKERFAIGVDKITMQKFLIKLKK